MTYKFPFLLAIISIIGGVFISILFGANEDIFKNRIAEGLSKNVKIQSIANIQEKSDKIKSEADKNWRYFQRYHFHSNAIGTMTLAFLLLLAFIKASTKEILSASYMISIGGFFYPIVWLMAGLYGPEMGRNEAKEAFAIFGYMGGLYLVGIIYALYLATTKPWKAPLNFAD